MEDDEGLGDVQDEDGLGEDKGGSEDDEEMRADRSFRLGGSREFSASLLLWFSMSSSPTFACILRTLLTEEGSVEDEEVIS